MHRIDHPTADTDVNGPGKPGFTGGDPVTQLAPTTVTADWLNALQEEVARAIESLGGTLDKANNGQLATLLSNVVGLGKDYVWTGMHTFKATLVAAAMALQGDIVYANAAGDDVEPKLRTWLIPLGAFAPQTQPDGKPGWTQGGVTGSPYAHGWVANVGGAVLSGDVVLPNNSKLKQVSALVTVDDIGGGGQKLRMLLARQAREPLTRQLTFTEGASEIRLNDGELVATAPGGWTNFFTDRDLVHIRFYDSSGLVSVQWVEVQFWQTGIY